MQAKSLHAAKEQLVKEAQASAADAAADVAMAAAAIRRVLALGATVGPAPEDRTWRDEWVALGLERAKIEGTSDVARNVPASNFESGGPDSVDSILKDENTAIAHRVAHGWPRHHAEAYTLLRACAASPIAAAIAEPSSRHAAATHALCAALTDAGSRQAKRPAPICYKHLTGKYGLATEDSAWKVVIGATAGVTLTTNGVTSAFDEPRAFPKEGGDFHQLIARGGRQVWEAVVSDVVAFRSARPDGESLRSMISTGGTTVFALPPLAKVTVTKVQEAGEWRAGKSGPTLRRRLFTVTVAF
jgi:hypothetical protein